jgi:chaperone BCS1
MDSIHLRKGQMEHLMMDMQTFKKRADWYTKRGIPHRRGYLLYGPPGTGKTSTIQAIAVSWAFKYVYASNRLIYYKIEPS